MKETVWYWPRRNMLLVFCSYNDDGPDLYFFKEDTVLWESVPKYKHEFILLGDL